MNYFRKRDTIRLLSTLVVIGIIDMDEFLGALVQAEDMQLDIDDISETFINLLYDHYSDTCH
jgi:hypothetical protein